MNRKATQIASAHIAFTGMNAGTNGNAETCHAVTHRGGAVDCRRRAHEGRKESIASRLDLRSTMPAEFVARHVVMLLEQLLPLPIAFLRGKSGGSDNVGEQHREKYPFIRLNRANPGHKLFDLLDEPILTIAPDQVVSARQQDKLRLRYLGSEITPFLPFCPSVVLFLKDKLGTRMLDRMSRT